MVNQNVSPSGLSITVNIGTVKVNRKISFATRGISVVTGKGTPTVWRDRTVMPLGLSVSVGIGSATVRVTSSLTGLPVTVVIGTPSVYVSVFPTATEVTQVYQSGAAQRGRRLEYRIIVGFTEYQWTGPREETFSGPLDPKLFRYSLIGGPPVVESGASKIYSYGAPPFEWVQTRALWFPRSPTKPFRVEVDVEFPVDDPVYSSVVTFGGAENFLGVEGEPMQVVAKGLAYTDTPAKVTIVQGSVTGGAPDGTYSINYSGADTTVRPDFVGWGFIHPIRKDTNCSVFAALGTAEEPVDVLRINRIRVESNGAGYEAEVYDSWSTANAGGTVDTAVQGERYVDDGITWAQIPTRYISGIRFDGGSAEDVSTGEITLSALTGLFKDGPWLDRPILIDTRYNVNGNYSTWRRLAVFTVTGVSKSRRTVKLSLTDRVMDRLDTPASQSFLGIAPASTALGEIVATNRGYGLPAIISHTIDVADIIRGGPWGPTDRVIHVPGILPHALDTGGRSLLGFVTGLADRLAQQVFTRARRYGPGKYGEFVIHLWNFGYTTSTWTFYGNGGALPSTIVRGSLELHLNDKAPGQVFERQNTAFDNEQFLSLGAALPNVGTFPSMSYPPNGAELSDSMIAAPSDSLSVLAGFPDKDGVNKQGGIAKFRYFMETLARRTVSFRVIDIDFLYIGQVITIDDPTGSGILNTERWIITALKYAIEKNRLVVNVYAHTATLRKALESTVTA